MKPREWRELAELIDGTWPGRQFSKAAMHAWWEHLAMFDAIDVERAIRQLARDPDHRALPPVGAVVVAARASARTRAPARPPTPPRPAHSHQRREAVDQVCAALARALHDRDGELREPDALRWRAQAYVLVADYGPARAVELASEPPEGVYDVASLREKVVTAR